MGRVKVFAGILLILSLMLVIGSMIMNNICENNRNTIPDQNWREISENLCHTFFYLNNLIEQFVNR
jgi:hypothetical protein